MDHCNLYTDIATRTGGDIYIGVVGPVRTGKSTFIKRFMELMVLPEIQSEAFSQRARDELPQSAAGRTIMTTEPKFVPEQAVSIDLEDGASFRTRLIDCVGYMVPGAMGHEENEKPRMVKSPWFDEEVPFDVAAETGTRKVICEHSTIGLVVTTDGSISDIPRSGYEKAEERVIQELEAIQKPFIILLNCVAPESLESMTLAEELSKKYGRTVMPVSCVELTEETITEILKNVLFEFPLKEIAFSMPKWVTMLDHGHWLQEAVYTAVQEFAAGASVMKDIASSPRTVECPYVKTSKMKFIDLGTGCAIRLRASAPSINMIRTEISTEVAPIVGSERQSEELVKSLLADFEEDPGKIWQSNIFGKSLHELVNEGLQNKLLHMPSEARTRLQETIERVINEGCSGLICIIL